MRKSRISSRELAAVYRLEYSDVYHALHQTDQRGMLKIRPNGKKGNTDLYDETKAYMAIRELLVKREKEHREKMERAKEQLLVAKFIYGQRVEGIDEQIPEHPDADRGQSV